MKKYMGKHIVVLAWIVVIPVFLLSQLNFWGISWVFAQTVTSTEAIDTTIITPAQQAILDAEEKAAKEKEAADAIKKEQDKVENKIEKEEKAKAALQQNLGKIQQSVSIVNMDISKTKAVINDTAENIARKEAEIKSIENRLSLQQEVLKDVLLQIYLSKKEPMIGAVLAGNQLSQVFGNVDHLLTLEDKLMALAADINESKGQIALEKESLANVKQEKEKVLGTKVDQKLDLVSDQIEVQEEIEDKNVVIAKLQKQLTELQGDLNALSGKSYSAKNIRDAVEDASKETGVPEGVLYGFLKMETNLGANTGKCTYAEVEKVSVANYKKYGSKYKASIALLTKRKNLFYDLVADLGYDKNKKVSCSPSGYIGQGGAMGIPQFMSDVWQGYSARIASATGNKTPDPWNLTDGVMAMAIKLRGAGATSSSASVIKKASINYLGTFHAPYYNGIVYWSKNYKLLFQ